MMLRRLNSLGPGLLYAGAAIGVSHLVQSTQAGAMFGYSLIIVIVLANVMKYPFFEFGPRYANATGESLMHGYYKLHPSLLGIFLLMTWITMFIVQAAVSVVTAGLAYQLIGISPDALEPWVLTILVLLISIALLWSGTYRVIDRVMKFIILTLTITTLICLFLSLGADVDRSGTKVDFDLSVHFAFFISFMGWMPAPLDLSVWHSLWSFYRNREMSVLGQVKEGRQDFQVGYWGTVFLAICFLLLGAFMLYGTGKEMPSGAGAFAAALIGIYTDALGSWSFPLIAVAAFATMLSTTITCLDAFGRVMSTGSQLVRRKQQESTRDYRIWIAITSIGAVLILALFAKDMITLVRFITIVSFLAAPVIAVLNYLVVTSAFMPLAHRPSLVMRLWSLAGMLFLLIFSGWYLFTL